MLGAKGLILRHLHIAKLPNDAEGLLLPSPPGPGHQPWVDLDQGGPVSKASNRVFVVSEAHDVDELQGCADVTGQLGFRTELVKRVLAENGVERGTLQAVVGRGGLVRPLQSGTYEVDAGNAR